MKISEVIKTLTETMAMFGPNMNVWVSDDNGNLHEIVKIKTTISHGGLSLIEIDLNSDEDDD